MAGRVRSLGADAALGALAGVVGALALGQVSGAIYSRTSRLVRLRETWARGGSNTHTIAARKAAGLVGAKLDNQQAAVVGEVLPFVVGTTSAALYGVARPHLPAPAPVRGLAFGAAVWLLGDEIGNAATGVTPGPGAFPWQTHARGLAAHLAFGLVTEGVLSAIDALQAHREARPAVGTPKAERVEAAVRS